MTQEEKDLLLKDLCARLPYGVKTIYKDTIMEIFVVSTFLDDMCCLKWDSHKGYYNQTHAHIGEFKPYLRPMSLMTEEECDMVEEILGDNCIFDFMSNGDVILKQGQFSQKKLSKLYDYYNSIHIDYRGLIPMGLALEAPEGMYKID